MTLDRGHTVVCPAYALYQRITMDGDGDGWQFSADALRPASPHSPLKIYPPNFCFLLIEGLTKFGG